jgi:hypothetical protein
MLLGSKGSERPMKDKDRRYTLKIEPEVSDRHPQGISYTEGATPSPVDDLK